MNAITHLVVLSLVVGSALLTPSGLLAQQPDSLSLEEILRGGPRPVPSSVSSGTDSLSPMSLRNRRLTAIETFRNAGRGFDLEAWIEDRRAFLDRVRARFGLDAVEFPTVDTISRPTVGQPGPGTGESSEEAGIQRGASSTELADRATPDIGEERDWPEADGPDSSPEVSDILLQLVDEATVREDLLFEILLRLDARLERLERVAGTLPDSLSTDELSRLLRECAPSHPIR